MSNIWQENLYHCLDRAKGFYTPKVWTDDHNRIWVDALRGHKSQSITDAFGEYFKVGKHMPKPTEIISIIQTLNPRKPPSQKEIEIEPINPASPIIAAAWIRLNKLQSNFILCEQSDIKMSDDEAILICNMEANRLNFADAINEIFWLEDVWGKPKPARTPQQGLDALSADRINYGTASDYSDLLQG